MRYLTYTYTLTLKFTLTHTHTWNQLKQFRITLLRGFPKQFLKKKENYRNSTIKNSIDQIFM